MTTFDILATLWRRWYIAFLGIALTIGAMALIVARPGIYFTQVDVVFLAPKSTSKPDVVKLTPASLIAAAGLVERTINGGAPRPEPTSPKVTLATQGIREGVSVRLPDSGGQWTHNFDRPVLSVEVVGATEQVVRRQLDEAIGTIDDTLHEIQAEDGIKPNNEIRTSSSPNSATVNFSRGDPKRSLAAALLLGLGLTILAAVGFDRRMLARPVDKARPRTREMVSV